MVSFMVDATFITGTALFVSSIQARLIIYIDWTVHGIVHGRCHGVDHERCHGHPTPWRRPRTNPWSSMDDAMDHVMDEGSFIDCTMAQSMDPW